MHTDKPSDHACSRRPAQDLQIGSTRRGVNERINLCTACLTGEYPIPVLGEHEQLAQVKFDFEALGAGPDAT